MGKPIEVYRKKNVKCTCLWIQNEDAMLIRTFILRGPSYPAIIFCLLTSGCGHFIRTNNQITPIKRDDLPAQLYA